MKPDHYDGHKYFDFKDEEVVLKFENIVRACFANPKRTAYPCVRYASIIKYSELYKTPESILELARSTIPNSLNAFDEKKIKFFSEEGMKKDVDIVKWKEGLRDSRWFGPFVWNDT